MNQPQEQFNNERKFEVILQELAPELYLIYETQKLTQVSWEVIREAIIALHDVAWNGGSGHVDIYILNGVTDNVAGNKMRKLKINTIVASS